MEPDKIETIEIDAKVPTPNVEINKDTVMEDALSHTTTFTPFTIPKDEPVSTNESENNKKGIAFLIAIAIILLGFVISLPFITNFIGK